MARLRHFGLTAAAAFLFTACSGNASANDANTVSKSEMSGPAKAEIIALENSAYEAWKSKDANFWSTFLSEKFVGWGSRGKVGKALAIKEHARADCEVKSYALSEEHVSSLGENGALITYKATVNGTCGGEKLPMNSRAATIYARDGEKWKPIFHAEAVIVDPKETSAKLAEEHQSLGEDREQLADRDAHTDALLSLERAVWEAWRTQDVKKIAVMTADDISFINIFGVYLANKADALRDWSGTYCDVKSVGFSDSTATMLSSTVGILTFKAIPDGTCYGQKVGPIWGSSVYVKHGDVWKWTFGINLPGR
jgi:ketosteroid isomerase-like protein